MRDETFSQLSAAGKSHSRKSCAPTRSGPTHKLEASLKKLCQPQKLIQSQVLVTSVPLGC